VDLEGCQLHTRWPAFFRGKEDLSARAPGKIAWGHPRTRREPKEMSTTAYAGALSRHSKGISYRGGFDGNKQTANNEAGVAREDRKWVKMRHKRLDNICGGGRKDKNKLRGSRQNLQKTGKRPGTERVLGGTQKLWKNHWSGPPFLGEVSWVKACSIRLAVYT